MRGIKYLLRQRDVTDDQTIRSDPICDHSVRMRAGKTRQWVALRTISYFRFTGTHLHTASQYRITILLYLSD